MRIVVDLPAPLGPRNPKTSPGGTSRNKASTARVVAKRLLKPSARSAGMVAMADLLRSQSGTRLPTRIPGAPGRS
jgi:hypothetical protein